MATQAAPPVRSKAYKRIVVVSVIGALLFVALVGGWAYWWFSSHSMAGLEGTWRDTNNPKHLYEFRANGDVDTWTGSKSFWNRIGWTATWRRSGQEIIIRTDRNWDLKGQLEGETIRGKLLIRDETGETVVEVDTVWQKE